MRFLYNVQCRRVASLLPSVYASRITRCSNDSSKNNNNGAKNKENETSSYFDNYYRIFNQQDTIEEKKYCTHVGVESEEPFGKQSESEISKTLSNQLTHTSKDGKLNMVDVGHKPDSLRAATAFCKITLGQKTFSLVKSNSIKKGDVLTVAKIAGIMAAKQTSSVIPLCHPIPLTKIDVDLELEEEQHSILVYCTAKTQGKTGVEMEALMGVTTAALTVYDMCKAVTRDMVISDVKLLKKTGGVRGDYQLNDDT